MPMILPYREGSLFAVPLQSGGFARGIVARSAPKGGMLYGFFYGPRLSSVEANSTHGIDPQSALMSNMFGDLFLINGRWSIFGLLPNWRREDWRMPAHIRQDPLMSRAWIVHRSDSDPSEILYEEEIEYETNLPKDTLAGAEFIELKLSSMLI